MENQIEVYCTDYPEEGTFFITQADYDAEPQTFTIIKSEPMQFGESTWGEHKWA